MGVLKPEIARRIAKRVAPSGKSRLSCACTGADYEDDEREFMLAMDRYKREQRRPYPAWTEVLAVLKSLGWRKA